MKDLIRIFNFNWFFRSNFISNDFFTIFSFHWLFGLTDEVIEIWRYHKSNQNFEKISHIVDVVVDVVVVVFVVANDDIIHISNFVHVIVAVVIDVVDINIDVIVVVGV